MDVLTGVSWPPYLFCHSRHCFCPPFPSEFAVSMSEQTARLVARVRHRLQRTTRRMTWAELAFGAAVAVGTVAAVWLFATVLEATFWLGTTSRTAVAAAVGTVAVGVGATLLARPLGQLVGLLPGPNEETVARTVGQHHPGVADRLVNLLQLADGKRSYAPAPMVDRAVQNLAEDLDEVSFEEVENFGRAQRAVRLASVPLAGVLAFLLIAPSTFIGASERLLAPNTEFARPAPFQLSTTPGSVRLVRGDSLQITVRTTGEAPETVTFHRRDSSSTPTEDRSLYPDSSGTVRHTISNVRQSFEYRLEAPPVQTDWFEVEVANRPRVQHLQLRIAPPAYTGLPARTLDPNVGDVSALPGSEVTLSATLGGPPVKTARLVFNDETSRPLPVENGDASGSFVLRQEGTYRLQLESTNGTSNRNPIAYQLSLQSDAHPSVSFLEPEGTTELTDDLVETLRVRLSDDYGFSQAKLFYRSGKEDFEEDTDSFSSVVLPLSDPGHTDQELVYEWLLAQDTDLEPEPGDVITYYVRAWDNDTVNGPKSARTAAQRLRMPSLPEQYDRLDETQENATDQMEQLRRRSDSTQDQFQQLREELRRTREADWQDRRQLERIQEKQQSMNQGAERLSEQVEEMNRQMQQNGLSSSEMSQQFQELQRVVDEMKSPELMEALEQLKNAMQNSDLHQMQRALEQVEKNQESAREQLERTISLFKQLKAQQKLDEMARRAREMSEEQEQLRKKTRERMETAEGDDSTDGSTDSTSGQQEEDARPADEANSTPNGQRSSSDAETSDRETSTTDQDTEEARRSGRNEDLATEQEGAEQKMRNLEDAMEEAEQDMQDVDAAPQKRIKQLNDRLQQEDLPEQMQQNSKQLRQNQLQDAEQGQKQTQNSLQEMQKQLSQMKSQMQGRQRQINLAGLRTALENTLRLSKRQEDLRTTIDKLSSEGPTVRSYARDQKDLSDGVKVVTDSLQSIAKRIPEMSRDVREKSGNALRAMETAMTALDEQNAGKATGHQKTSMMHLNELALLLSNLLEQLQEQQGSGSGMSMQQMLQQLQQMSGQQQKLNKQIQQHLNQQQGERLSPGEGDRRQDLVEQQRRIKQQLEEMNVGSEARDRIMGDLEKIAEQMEQTAQDFERGRHSRELIERQQQILTRLLNAQQSLRTQGKEEQRQGQESEENYEQQSPGELPAPEAADQLHRDLIRALEMGYSSDYEELIKRYFELLQENESETP